MFLEKQSTPMIPPPSAAGPDNDIAWQNWHTWSRRMQPNVELQPTPSEEVNYSYKSLLLGLQESTEKTHL